MARPLAVPPAFRTHAGDVAGQLVPARDAEPLRGPALMTHLASYEGDRGVGCKEHEEPSARYNQRTLKEMARRDIIDENDLKNAAQMQRSYLDSAVVTNLVTVQNFLNAKESNANG